MDQINTNIKDILDSLGINNNFLNNKPYSAEYKELGQKWKILPMYKDINIVKNFFELIDTKQVILLVSGTGSGKTVLVPKFLLKYIITMGLHGKIAITNPKILTTVYNAEYAAKTLDVKLGEEVGYKFKGSPSNVISQDSRLLYITDGLLLATILSGDSLLSSYKGVIIDEAHERQVQIDILLKMLKDILYLRPDFKLIIMSATINAEIFRDYFNVKGLKYGQIEVSTESNQKITQHWLAPEIKVTNRNYLEKSMDIIIKILDTSTTGDILVFVPTQNDTINGCRLIKEKCPNKLKMKKKVCDELFCVEVYSKMKLEFKELAVDKDKYKQRGFNRKIIFATNVAESSITFDGLVYVIDTGYEIVSYYNIIDNSVVISSDLISKAQVKQRIGRAGRTQSGIAYHMYAEKTFNELIPYPNPTIITTDIIDYIGLFIKYTKTIKHSMPIIQGLITIPKIEQVVYSIYRLYFIKYLKLVSPSTSEIEEKSLSDSIDDSADYLSTTETTDNKKQSVDKTILLKIESIEWDKIKSFDKLNQIFNGTTTSIGMVLQMFRSSPIISALAIIMAHYSNCQKEIIQIMAIIEISEGKLSSLFYFDRNEKNNVIKYFENYVVAGSDHLTIFNIYNKLYKAEKYDYLNRKTFELINSRISQLTLYASSISEKIYEYIQSKYKLIQRKPTENINDNIIYILAMSHYYNLLHKDSATMYTSLHYIQNSIAAIEYIFIMPNIQTHTNYIISYSLSNVFGKKSFQCLTQIPDSIIQLMKKNENLPYLNRLK
jgi:HrpA-like RNA helicase